MAKMMGCVSEISDWVANQSGNNVEKRNAKSLVVNERRQKIVLSMSVKQMQDVYEVAVKDLSESTRSVFKEF